MMGRRRGCGRVRGEEEILEGGDGVGEGDGREVEGERRLERFDSEGDGVCKKRRRGVRRWSSEGRGKKREE